MNAKTKKLIVAAREIMGTASSRLTVTEYIDFLDELIEEAQARRDALNGDELALRKAEDDNA